MTIHDKAQLFRSLHHNGHVLALPNAWDVVSARVIEDAGAAAIATTSAGVAWSLGAADGNRLDRDRALDLVARVVAAVKVPVTADIESGFAHTADGLAATIQGILAAGAVGVNLEDGVPDGPAPLRPVAEQAERIAAARRAADAAGVPLFINARTDGYLRGAGVLSDTLARAEAYLAAGADGIFVPGVTDAPTVATLAKAIDAPLNVLAGPGAPSVAELGELGVARVSIGSSLAAAAYALAKRGARELLGQGTYESLVGGLDYHELNDLLAQRPGPAGRVM